MISPNDAMFNGKTAKERNKRFGKMKKRGDIRWSSAGHGIVYDGKVGTSSRTYYALQIKTCLRHDTTAQSPRLIRNGVVVG